MARTDSLQNFLTDIAAVIKEKREYSEETKLQASDFDIEIGGIGEDLEETIDEQDKLITEQQTQISTLLKELKDKATIGGPAKLNVFVQEEEPETKDGIWVATQGELNKLMTVDTISTLPTNATPISSDIGSGNVYPTIFSIGDEVYANKGVEVFKYNDAENVWIFHGYLYSGSDVDVNSIFCVIDEYLYYSYVSTSTAPAIRRYNPVTNTNERVGSFDGYSYAQHCVAINERIYFINSGYSAHRIGYFDTVTNTLYNGAVNTIDYGSLGVCSLLTSGGDLYFYTATEMYKVNLADNTYSKVCDIPVQLNAYCGYITTGTITYLFGGDPNTTVLKFDSTTGMIENISDVVKIYPYNTEVLQNNVCVANNKIYFMYRDAWGYVKNNFKMDLPSVILAENSLALVNGNTHQATLITPPDNVEGNIGFKFASAHFTDSIGNIDDSLSIYKGDGSEWIKIGGAE